MNERPRINAYAVREHELARYVAEWLARENAQRNGGPIKPDEIFCVRFLRAVDPGGAGYTHDIICVLAPKDASAGILAQIAANGVVVRAVRNG